MTAPPESFSQATTGSDSSSLVSRLKVRDPEAWRRLARIYGPLVLKWTRRLGLGAEDAADVTQEVFHRVAANIGQFRRDRPEDSFRGWLWVITRNQANDHFRRAARQDHAAGGSAMLDRLAQVPEAASPEEEAGHELRDLARRAMALLETDFETSTWQAFWRTTVACQPPQQVAEELGLSVGAVYVAKSRVLARLRAELGDA